MTDGGLTPRPFFLLLPFLPPLLKLFPKASVVVVNVPSQSSTPFPPHPPHGESTGGATGVGSALDAATRGLNVALVEGEDFGSGASSTLQYLPHPNPHSLFALLFISPSY